MSATPRRVRIAPSILSADFSRLADEIASIEAGGADQIHVDVMDGHFVPNLTFGPILVEAVRKLTTLPLDVHLMITDPLRYAPDFAHAGADALTMHAELGLANPDAIAALRDHGVRVGISVNPATPVEPIFGVLDELDLVLVMSVVPGFGGQSFMEEALPKLRTLAHEREWRHLDLELSVDGGINAETGKRCVEAGADVLVAGSYVFKQADRGAAIASLR